MKASSATISAAMRRVAGPVATLVLVMVLVLPQISGAQGTGADTIAAPAPAPAGLPLASARVARFRVTEGTWMSLDVSPDGRMIAFDLLGDLYTVPVRGGKARRITSGMAINRQPRYSPDGQHLLFVSDRSGSENVWIADRDGRHAHQLSKLHGYDGYGAATSPAWSPDGQRVVVSLRLGATRPGGSDPAVGQQWLLAVYDATTGRMRWVSDTTCARSVLGPTFGPDENTVYAAVDAIRQEPWKDLPNWRIAGIDLATGQIQPEMAANVGRAGMRPALSRDGRYLAYATSSGSHVGLRLRHRQTDQEWWLIRDVLDDPPYGTSESRDLVPGYAFMPDSKALVVSYGGKLHRVDLATGRSTTIPFIVDVERPLGPLTIHQFSLPDTAVRTRSVLQPALSPDGSWVAFSALDRLWVMELPHDGRPAGQPRRLTGDSAGGEFYPSWSPDGRWIVYSAWVDGEGGAVRRVRVIHEPSARPPPSERLTSDTALYFQTVVAPEGDRVVAVRASLPPERLLGSQLALRPLDLTLSWMPTAGGRPHVGASLATAFRRYRYPLDQLYFIGDSNRIHVGLTSWPWTSVDGSAPVGTVGQERLALEATESADVVGVFSPDGRRAFITRKYALFELSLPGVIAGKYDTLNLEQARTQPFGAASGAAHRWGTALAPWLSWSPDGKRVVFSQGGTLFLGETRPGSWTTFTRLDVPLQVPVEMPHGTLALRGARLVTMRGRQVIEHGDLVVRNNRIAALGAAGTVPIPTGARVLDVTGKTILPGYVDIHNHIFPPKGVHPQQHWQYLAWLASGVTTMRDPAPGTDNEVFTYRERERAGDLLSPRIFSTGVPYYGTDPPIRTLDDARDAVRPNADYFGSETFKVYYDHATDRRARQLLAIAVVERGLNGTAHTNGIELALASMIDGLSGMEHAPDIRIYDDVATLVGRSNSTYTQTYGGAVWGSLTYMRRRYGWPWEWPKTRRFVPPSMLMSTCVACSGARLPMFSPLEVDGLRALVSASARVVAKGGRVGMGAESDLPALDIHYEMWLHALGGMPNHEIMRSATIIGAQAIGHADDFGSLEPGKLADLQILDRNPLEDIHHTTSIRYVMKNGRLYTADDLTEIWPHHRPLPSIYIWDDHIKMDSRQSLPDANH